MADINLRNFDLNLLVIFDALMSERNVSRAAEKVFLTQSATSHALNRLRGLLDDQILVKTEKGLMPTPRALAMEEPVRNAITQIKQSLMFPEPFDPEVSTRRFVIYAVEHFEYVLLPNLLNHLEKVAPNVSIDLDLLGDKIPESGLTEGHIHFVVGVEGLYNVSKRLHSQPLFEEDFAIITRRNHPTVSGKVTTEQMAELSHVYYSEAPHQLKMGSFMPMVLVEKWFEEKKITPKVAFRTASLFPAVRVAASTDYVLAVPRSIANMLSNAVDFQIVEPPDDFITYKHNLIWHPLYEKAPGNTWMREQLFTLADEIGKGNQGG